MNSYHTIHTHQAVQTENYPLKPYEYSSHTLVNSIIRGVNQNILDIGCGPGAIEALANTKDNKFIGLDRVVCRNRHYFTQFIIHNLEERLPFKSNPPDVFDYILMLDILEHLINADQVLQDVYNIAAPETKIVISVPNVANIYVRLSLLLGYFEYTDRGILDKTHVRFYTETSLKRWVAEQGFEVEQTLYTIIPLNEIFKQRQSNFFLRFANSVLYRLTNRFSGLLAYQLILVVCKGQSK